jgi:aminoglycoside phosphotransferase (APT) family kinase protein
MHPDEIATDPALVRRLLQSQFPRWANLPIERVASGGTVNAIYRLGDELYARLPLREAGASQIEKEHHWLPRLAPHLPLAIPTPLALGEPATREATDPALGTPALGTPEDNGYPFAWAVYPWLPGDLAFPDRLTDLTEAARTLATFLRALQSIDTTGAPVPGAHNYGRGVPLATRDAGTRRAIAASEGLVDTAAVTAAWDADSTVTEWDHAPVWVHGDLQPANLLATDGRLSAVIDWGGLGIGDPAVDLLPAWNLFSGESREVFRATLDVDDATWARGRAWALSAAIIALPYYIDTNPAMVRLSRTMLDAVLADHASRR